MSWYAEAPANIALIKYMGKRVREQNIPDNPSISYTLPHLRTSVQLEINHLMQDEWLPQAKTDQSFKLSTQAQERFLLHLQRIKARFQNTPHFNVFSSNNFPLGVGIASSASSFAALTKCALNALTQLSGQVEWSIQDQAQLSRLGSGSSCRSFFAPWCVWEGDQVYPIDTPYTSLIHRVVVFSQDEKKVSSSAAHQRVLTSPFYSGRQIRASKRMDSLITAMHRQDWGQMYHICYEEFLDMHHLFETAESAFSYRLPVTQEVLNELQSHWKMHGDGPLITMDAGSSIHLLYRPDQDRMANQIQQSILKPYVVF